MRVIMYHACDCSRLGLIHSHEPLKAENFLCLGAEEEVRDLKCEEDSKCCWFEDRQGHVRVT